LEHIDDLIQQVGASNFISLFDAKPGFHQFIVEKEDRWLTSFICDEGQFEWTRTPFGMRSSGTPFSTAIKQILSPIRDFTKSYVDDMAVHSNYWQCHLDHIDRYLYTIQMSGLTLGLNKSEFAKTEVKFI
jgi:Reverse transcriptase (RNA-dependent DNA polymerase)